MCKGTNATQVEGGVLTAGKAAVSITNSSVHSNTAGDGGGVFAWDASKLNITKSMVWQCGSEQW